MCWGVPLPPHGEESEAAPGSYLLGEFGMGTSFEYRLRRTREVQDHPSPGLFHVYEIQGVSHNS